MAMDRTPRRLGHPEPGFWMIRLAKNGPEVPAAVKRLQTTYEPGNPTNLMERSPFIAAFIRGEVVAPARVWETRGRSISELEYEYQLRLARWANVTDEITPLAEPTKAVDLNAIPPLF